MKKTVAAGLIFTIISLQIFSQKAPLKWKKLTKEEINLKVYNDNPDIPAVIFYDYGQMYFDLNPGGNNLFIFRKRHVRMKILNENGLKYAKIKFVYDDMNCEYLSGELSFSIKAITHNILENGKIKITKLKYKNIKYSDSIGCLKIAEFVFPNVKVGSILEYEITTPTLKLIKPDTWYFQNKLPVIYSEFRARIPSEFSYIFSVKNIENLQERTFVDFNHVIDGYMYKGKHYIYTFNMSGTEYRFVNKYMPIIKNKKSAEKINIHLQHLKSKQYDKNWERITKALMVTTMPDYERKTPNQRRILDYPSGYIIYYLPTWEELNKRLLVDDKFGLAVIKNWNCYSILDSITNNKQSDIDKVKSIYNFVKNNMKWNKKYSLYADVSDSFIKKAYSRLGAKVEFNNVGNYFKKGEGSSSEINFVLMHLLYKAKIKIYPVLVNTLDNNDVDKNISDINQFKSVIALININNEKYLLDAALPDSKFLDISPKYDRNKMFIVKKEGFMWFK